MQTRNLLNLLLAIVLLSLIAVALLEPQSEDTQAHHRLTAIASETINQISIDRRHDTPIALAQQEDGSWWLTTPVKAPANLFRVNALLRLLEAKPLGRYPASEVDLSRFQLDPPNYTLHFNDRITLHLGTTTQLDQRRYSLINDEVVIIEEEISPLLIHGFTQFINGALLPPAATPNGFDLPARTIRRPGDHWLVAPRPPDYSPDQVVELSDRWRYAQAFDIRPWQGEEGEIIKIHLAGYKEPIIFHLLAREPDLILARPDYGIIYHLSATLGRYLLDLPPRDAAETPDLIPHAHDHPQH
jgi:hypothetical protein